MADIDLTIIAKYPPFSFLPERTITELQPFFSEETGRKNDVKFIRGKTRVRHLYVLATGAAELYYEKNGEKTLRRMLSEGDCFGGISILLNNSLAVRTMWISEDTVFYRLPADNFLMLCDEFDDFKEFFTNTFGKKMLDRSYADMIARQVDSSDRSAPFFHQRINTIPTLSLFSCPGSMTIRDAAAKMTHDDTGYLLVQNEGQQLTGIITDEDLRKRVVAVDFDKALPVSEIMSTPLITLSEDSQLFEAYMLMIKKGISHLPVFGDDGTVSGILTDRQVIIEQSRSPYFLIQEITRATTPEQLANIHSRLPDLLVEPIKNGVQPESLSALITAIADTVLDKIIELAIDKAGPPPCDFTFIVMGSEGRNEQTLKTDQDNAIIYEDLSRNEDTERANRYFLALADDICGWLNMAGYDYCDGNNMAQNPDWCQPLSVWEKYFDRWLDATSPEDLLYSSIFFDFRWAWGSKRLAVDLNEFLFGSLGKWSGFFFKFMVENAFNFRPPLGFFRNIVVQSKGEHKDTFDIKRAMMPIIDFARIYSLRHGIRETNTLARLEKIYEKRVLTKSEYEDIVQSYQYLMNLRFLRQITAISEGGRADNFINPKNLTRIDQTMLKEIFKRIEGIQQKMSIEFTGATSG